MPSSKPIRTILVMLLLSLWIAAYIWHGNTLSLSLHFEPGYLADTRMCPFWILMELRTMAVMVTTGAIGRAKLQSKHHHQQTNIQFFTGRMPFLSPYQQCLSIAGKISHFADLLTPSSPGIFQLCLWPLIAPGYLGEGCHASHQPSDASTPKNLLIQI